MALDNETIVVMAAAASIFLFVLFLADLMGKKTPITRRVDKLTNRAENLSESQRKRESNDAESGQAPPETVRELLKRFNLTSQEVQEPIRYKLLAAGIRGKYAVEMFLFAKLVAPFAVGGVAVLLLSAGFFGDLNSSQIMMFSAIGVLFGYLAPELYIKNLATKRSQAIQKTLPDGLDLLVICSEAGLSMDVALLRVAQELGPTGPELADELQNTAVELNFLPERRTALTNLAQRVDSKSIRSVVNTLLQTERYGTPLTQALRVLSEEFRDERMLKAEEKAARLPAILTVPMIVFILPTLFIVLIGPAAIDVYDQFVN